ncbi:MAG: formimidoylglutamase [Crocinitomicaceae bacterium]|nr:formimidoylglutamase [Crocinitomicaceae bacterium]
MKDISIYFKPLESISIVENSIGASVFVNDENGFPEIKSKGVAIIHVPEYRNSTIESSDLDFGKVFREELYKLFPGDNWGFNLYDLGTIVPGESVTDTYFALSQVVAELVKMEVVPFIVGGGQDLTMALYRGFEALEQMINICTIDDRLDVGEPNVEIKSDGFVSHLLMQRPCYLFNYASLGLQRPFVSKQEVGLFEKLFFDTVRLGEMNTDMKIVEPYLRNSDVVALDFKSIKQSETDSSVYSSPNGLYAEQVCQVSKYAGLSDKVSCFGVFELNPGQSLTATKLLAQIVWYFVDGVAQRVSDFPIGSRKNYTKFHVNLDDFSEDLIFYKSNKSARWWLEVKYQSVGGVYSRHTLVPCSQDDYDNALRNIIPNLWWKTLQKLS